MDSMIRRIEKVDGPLFALAGSAIGNEAIAKVYSCDPGVALSVGAGAGEAHLDVGLDGGKSGC
jgi:hypothetical protein